MRTLLEEMGHPQPKTPIQTDNTTAIGVVTNNVQPRRIKAMDMRFHWLRDRAARDQFRWLWRPGTTNLADYWTKHHCPAHHQAMRPEFLTLVKIYRCKAEWPGNRYLGMTLDWDYDHREVHISMPGYVHEALQKFRWKQPKKTQHQPHKHTVPTYGSKIQ